MEAAELLLTEAFTGTVASEHLRSLDLVIHDDPWSVASTDETPEFFLRRPADTSGALPRADRPRPHWSQRHGISRNREVWVVPDSDFTPTASRGPRLAEWFLQLVSDLTERGYFDHALPVGCEDARDENLVDPSLVLLERIGVPGLWPLTASRQTWDPDADLDTFHDLVEALHDLAARPRSRSYHSYWRHWHYADFSSPAGQALYRWRVNRVLRQAGIDLQLAEAGEDVGRLVHVAGDDRDDLVQRVLAAEPKRGTREHAIALFRGRGAGEPEKRSAIVALAGLLEQRRDLLKTELLSKDEGALFTIANQFDLRHRRADQRGNYAEAYLDWVFWWYLSTLELTDRLLARHTAGSTGPQ